MLNYQQGQEIIKILLGDGHEYVELFIEDVTTHRFYNFNNQRFNPDISISQGTGIRMWKNREITYYSIDSIAYEDIKALALKLVSKSAKKDVEFSKVAGKFISNEFGAWDIKTIKKQLSEYVDTIKSFDARITIGTSRFNTISSNCLIINSDGEFIKKTLIYSDISISCVATEGHQKEESYHRIAKQLNPKEIFDLFNQPKHISKIKEASQLAINLLKAKPIKSGKMPVILPNGFGAVLFHEAVGHPLEGVFISKNLSQYANKIGEKVASDLVTLIDDGTLKSELGSADFDDEGSPNQKRVLIENGILKNYLIDKYSGSLLNQKSNGAGRRESYRFINTSRMSNTFIKNGKDEVANIIKNTKYGFYAKKLGGGQVNPYTGQFNFGVSEGYLIENGEIKHLVKGATLIGNGLEIIKEIDMLGNDFAIEPGVCGSYSGMIPVTVGQPTLRIKQMTVGGN